jgi:hypothetical protein
MVLFSESVDDLKDMLDTLQSHTDKCDLVINIAKTKIGKFKNGWKVRTNEKWVYVKESIEILDQFVYLDVLLNSNGKILVTKNQLASQGCKALFALKASTKDQYTSLYLFDTYVCCILDY